MTQLILNETFDQALFDSRLHWFHPPQTWSINPAASVLVIQPEPKTDYWQKTHYGFEVDNGHFLYAEVSGDIVLTTHVRFQPMHQYDQAGLMVRISPHCWLKTSVEYEPDGPAQLGVVVTNHGYSDWSPQNFFENEVSLRIRREGSDYLVEYIETSTANQAIHWTPLRVAHLHEDSGGPIQAGLYACSPTGAGYVAEFDFVRIERGRVK